MSNFFLDTEFSEDDSGIMFISIGIVCDNGKEFYRVSKGFESAQCTDWVKRNVLTRLNTTDRAHPHEIKKDIINFVTENTLVTPLFWGYYADYDWFLFCRLLGGMLKLPTKWPQLCMDLKQWAIQLKVPVPKQAGLQHNALADAKWHAEIHKFLSAYSKQNRLD